MQDLFTTVFVDADNTLWDTDRVYADAQLTLLKEVEKIVGKVAQTIDRLAYIRAVDQAIAENHHAGLRYPPRLLVLALILVLRGDISADRAVRLAWKGGHDVSLISDAQVQALEEEFFETLRQPPLLRLGVTEGLQALRLANHYVFVLTEGRREKALGFIKHHGLVNFVSRVLEVKKDRRLFERVLRLSHTRNHAFMIGDQLDRDIRPAKEAGLATIYFPGGFIPKWNLVPNSDQPDYTVRDFQEAVDIILSQGHC